MRNRLDLIHNRALKLTCILPAHNEEDVISDFLKALTAQLKDITDHYSIIVVDDGSQDQTAAIVAAACQANPAIKLIELSRNFGKENALTAGLEHSQSADAVILMDCDFQHPIDVIPKFIQAWSAGKDMVYGIRDRKSEGPFKKLLTKTFYSYMRWMSEISTPPNGGDFRLLDKKVVTALNRLPERSRFMKGMYSWVGFSSQGLNFETRERAGGKSSWSFSKLASLAITGITSFSTIPLRVWGVIGMFISALSLLFAGYIVLRTFIFGSDVPGYASIIVAVAFFGGIQLLSIGIIGEYIARIFQEVKQRPRYIIKETHGLDDVITKN